MARPDLTISTDDLRWTLHAVYWGQTAWMLMMGVYLIASPPRRYGNTFMFLLQIPHGDDILGTVFVLAGFGMLYALIRGSTRFLRIGLFVGGLLTWMFGFVLLLGAVVSPTGGLSSLFCLYVGGHMLVQRVLLSRA